MIIIFSIFLALLLWGIIQTTSLTLIIKEVRKANWKEWINIIVRNSSEEESTEKKK